MAYTPAVERPTRLLHEWHITEQLLELPPHPEWIERPVVEPLEEEDESEDSCDAERRCEEPPSLAQRVNEEDRNEDGYWRREC